MCYARNVKDYDNIFKTFCQVAPVELIQYFLEHLHLIKAEWVLGDKCQTGNFLNTTNNNSESINSKLKSATDCYSNLENFVKQFFNVLSQQTFVGLQDVLKTSSRHVLKTSSTRLQRNNFSSFKTS